MEHVIGITMRRTLCISLVVFFCRSVQQTEARNYPIGGMFDMQSANLKYAFERQIDILNQRQSTIKLKPMFEILRSTDSFAVSNAICSLLKGGVYGIIGVCNASALSTIQSYSNTFQVPFISLSMASSNHGPFQLFMRPMFINGILDVIIHYGWSHILYMYDTDEGLIRLQQLFQAVNQREHITLDIDVKRVTDATNCSSILKELHKKNDKLDIRVFLDIPLDAAEEVIQDIKSNTSKYYKFHFLLGDIRIEETRLQKFSIGGINVTGFQLLNYTYLNKTEKEGNQQWRSWDWPVPLKSRILDLGQALVIDAVDLLHKALTQLEHGYSNYGGMLANSFGKTNLKCTDNSYVSPHNGTQMMSILKDVILKEGVTGKDVSFDNDGYRENFKLRLESITVTMALAEVGTWSREEGFELNTEPRRILKPPNKENELRIVTTIMDEPYIMFKDPKMRDDPTKLCGKENFIGFCKDLAEKVMGDLKMDYDICLVKDHNYGQMLENGTWDGMIGELIRQDPPYLMYKDEETKKAAPRCGNENFIGFCADLARKVAELVKFKYKLCLVKDAVYGEKLDNESWNGMIGEITRDEVSLAIAPLTITSQRERVVDFTKPFMSLGISIMIKKTQLKKANVFSFMDPLSYEIWMCILFAYIGVSVVLFLVSRFSPSEWHVENGSNITNDFSISNSLWYSLGAFMQQGCDISPRSVSGRIVGSVWWFFTLIIISSYTANLAAFLTVERMLTPIESAEDLSKQTEIQYGILKSGSTKTFFKHSKFPVHERMWAYMQSASDSVFVDNNREGIARVRQGNYAFLLESTINDYNNMRQPCDTMKVGQNLDSKGYGIATPIDSDLKEKLTLAVLKLRETGQLEELQKYWWDSKSECEIDGTSMDGGQTELTLNNVAGIFYILVAGLILSVIIACFEFLYKSKLDSKRSKKSFGAVLRCKARLSFRGSLDRNNPVSSTPLRNSMSTYTYTGPTQMVTNDGYPDNLHTQV